MDADRDRGLTAGGVLVAKVRPKQGDAFPALDSVCRADPLVRAGPPGPALRPAKSAPGDP
jgi:hypothetical protein